MLKHAKTSAAGPASPSTLVGGDDWNADHTADAGGIALTATTSAPAAPAAGGLQLWAYNVVGRALPAWAAPDGTIGRVQPFLGGRRHLTIWQPELGNGSITVIGAPNARIGNLNTRNLAATSLFTALSRAQFSTSGAAGQTVYNNGNYLTTWRGSAAGMGGFHVVMRWGCSDAATVATARSFYGLAATYFGNVNPSTALNIIGVGTDSGDANFSVMINDGTGVATKIPLGTSFPDHTLGVDVYELNLYCAPNSTSVALELARLNTGDVYRTVLTSDLPAASQFLVWIMQRNNGATALPVSFDFFGAYGETT